MINDIRIRARRRMLELDNANINIDPKYCNAFANNHSEGELFVYVLVIVIFFL